MAASGGRRKSAGVVVGCVGMRLKRHARAQRRPRLRQRHCEPSTVHGSESPAAPAPTPPSPVMADTQPDLPPVADEESGVLGLTEVEPSPVEETPVEFKQDYFPPASSRTATLGLGNHGPAYYRMFPALCIPAVLLPD